MGPQQKMSRNPKNPWLDLDTKQENTNRSLKGANAGFGVRKTSHEERADKGRLPLIGRKIYRDYVGISLSCVPERIESANHRRTSRSKKFLGNLNQENYLQDQY